MSSSIDALLKAQDQWLKLGISKSFFSEEELTAAIAKAHSKNSEIAAVLNEAGKLSTEQAAQLKADSAEIAFVDVLDYQIDRAVLKLVPESVARQHKVLPLYKIDSALTVAVSDPWNAVAIDALRASTKLPIIQTVVSTSDAIERGIERAYGMKVVEDAAASNTSDPAALASAKAGELAGKPPEEAASEVSIIRLVDAVISEALDVRASDIHLEPDAQNTRVRFRIDGVLHEMKLLPAGLHEAICSRIKILAKLDIAEHRVPQDGRITMTVRDHNVDMRISTYPTVLGENVVIRLLDQSSVGLKLSELGFQEEMQKDFEKLIQYPHGMLLVTGPTGSGKTTTLYAGMTHINSMAKNIMTIEDPVEYHLSLIRQTQINPKAGVTFTAGLRSIVRQDPDVIMVGEIRDSETAEIAIHAALTGHLVLSTLHTNDAVGAVGRLLDMGVEPYLLSGTLIGVIAQRLVRRICPNCQEGHRPDAELKKRIPELKVVYQGRGCRECRDTGFSGRIGIFEQFIIDEAAKAKIAARATSSELHAQALKSGMRTMRADGFIKVQQGLVSLDELDRLVPVGLAR